MSKTTTGSKDQSPSIASFEELQGVIDFLSGSSTSSLAINEKGEKIRQNHHKTHKRNNSTTSLPQSSDSKTKSNAEGGKLKLCHKKSASFSGKTSELTGETSDSTTKTQDQQQQKQSSVDSLTTQETPSQLSLPSKDETKTSSSSGENSKCKFLFYKVIIEKAFKLSKVL